MREFRVWIFLATLVLCFGARAQSAVNYQGLWWAAPAGSQSGWGINFAHQGDTIFASWFTYDATGKGLWLVMTAPKTGNGVYSGTFYQLTGPAFNTIPFPPIGSPGGAVATAVGSGTLTFADANNGTFAYTIDGIAQTKPITRQIFGAVPTCIYSAQPNFALASNYQDLWWVVPPGSEAGWGINLTHQSDTIFGTWFTYDQDRTPMWLVVTANKIAPGTYSGTQVFRLTGPPFNSVPFPPQGNPGGATGINVGTATFTFSDGNTGTFMYTVNGVTQAKNITRELFQPPAGTICMQAIPTDFNINGVAWVGTQFIAAGGKPGGTGLIYTSSTGITWTTFATTNPLRGVAASGGLMVIVGVQGTILTSPDGATWTPQSANTAADLNWVAGSGTHFVAVGTGGTILTTSDGTAWRARTSGTGNDLFGIAYSGTTIVVVGDAGTILTSPDGSAWTLRSSGTTSDLLDVKWTGSQFIAVGTEGTILTSADGLGWTARSSGVEAGLHGVAWSGSQYVVVEGNGNVLVSPDGIAWTQRNTGNLNSLGDIAWSGTLFVAVGVNGTVLTSPDGVTWTPR